MSDPKGPAPPEKAPDAVYRVTASKAIWSLKPNASGTRRRAGRIFGRLPVTVVNPTAADLKLLQDDPHLTVELVGGEGKAKRK